MYRLYYGCVSIFKPILAKRLVELFNPKVVLDPCCGWGSRMIGCIAGGVDLYVGFDTNVELEPIYQNIISDFNFGEKTRIRICDCMDIDYNSYEYDMLLTSPPYFNTEVYNFSQIRSKQDWNDWYKTCITKWFNGLKVGGVLALAIPFNVYGIAITICGDCDDAWSLGSVKRCKNKFDTEMLFIWIKK